MHKTRERSTNFSSDERDLLVSLLQKYKDILENKKNDGATWKNKEMAWKLIEKQFNAQSDGSFRSSKTLRIKYEGLKRTVRKKSALQSELNRTGGGPNRATRLDGTEQQIKSMISLNTTHDDSLESVYDSDVLPHASKITSEPPIQNDDDTMQDTMPMEEYVEVIYKPISEDSELETKTDLDEQHNIHSNDTTAEESSLIKTVNSAPSESKKPFDKLTEAKLELIQLQKQLLEAEIIEKKKQWEFNEKERKWKEEEYKLKLDKLRKELNE